MVVSNIAAGSYYSLAITDEGSMYAWGEAKLGQLGTGRKHRDLRTPTQVQFPKEENEAEVRIRSCSAGFGHTAALSEHGELYVWGFNTYGQVGTHHKKTVWAPEKITTDKEGNALSNFQKVACSKYATFAID